MTRAATAPELALFRAPGQFSKLRAAIFAPSTVYTARINQTFTTTDGILEVTYDTGSGTLSDVKADMTLLVGSAAGLHDIGITRIRSMDATKVYIGETSDIEWADNLYLTVINDFGLWARHVLIVGGEPKMDGGITYSDQHKLFDPVPIMGANRVLKLEGASVSAVYDASLSYVYDSTISAYAWVAPTASASSGMTTATPTITFNATGWHVVYLTVTAANGKSFMGVRYVYVWSEASPPASASISTCRGETESGGWEFELTLYDNVTLSDVRDHALVIVFAEDYYGATKQSIGTLSGCENILVQGWIASETINYEPERGEVSFTGYTAHFWMGKIPSFPDGVELIVGDATAWTNMPKLTVDRGVWHFLHWRTTATRVMDVFRCGDTRYTQEVSSLASNLWDQLREMAFLQIFARAGCNAQNQFYLGIHPQLTAEASRSGFPTVMTITKQDWEGAIGFERVTLPRSAVVDLSGIAVTEQGEGVPYFALSSGHAYPRYGSLDLVDSLLVENQTKTNELSGLYRAWQNNPYPDIPIILSANNRLIDCFPNQQCAIVIDAADTIRGISYNGNLFPTAVSFVHDVDTGYLHTEVNFEAEVFADLAIDGDVPTGSADTPLPASPNFPPLPPFVSLFPADISTADAPVSAIAMDDNKGLLYTKNFHETPVWQFGNAGIPSAEQDDIADFYLTPSGSVWVVVIPPGGFSSSSGGGIYYAPFIGGIFTKLVGWDWFVAEYPSATGAYFIGGFAVNQNKPEEVAFIAGWNDFGPFTSEVNFWIGDRVGFTKKASCANVNGWFGSMSFGGDKWILLNEQYTFFAFWDSRLWRFSADGATVEYEVGIDSGGAALLQKIGRASTTPRFYFWNILGNKMYESPDNGTTITLIGDAKQTGGGIGSYAVSPTGQYMLGNWDSGLKGFSSDYGATWSALATLPPGGAYCFAYAGGTGVTSRWIAARGVVRYSPDFGATWQNKEGNINQLIPAGLTIVKIIVPGYAP